MQISSPQSFGEVVGEIVAVITGASVASAVLDLNHVHVDNWWSYWVVGGIVLVGVAMVVENAANGGARLARAVGTALSDLEAKVERLENSIEEIKRP